MAATYDLPTPGPCDGVHTWEVRRAGPRRTQWVCAGCGSPLDLATGHDPDDVIL